MRRSVFRTYEKRMSWKRFLAGHKKTLRGSLLGLGVVVAGAVGFLVFRNVFATCSIGGEMCITSVTPSAGPVTGGTNVTIRGNNFLPPIEYITDGLVLHYDGINNTGSGHSNTAATWTDLTGNGNHGTIVGGASWGANYFQFDLSRYVQTNYRPTDNAPYTAESYMSNLPNATSVFASTGTNVAAIRYGLVMGAEISYMSLSQRDANINLIASTSVPILSDTTYSITNSTANRLIAYQAGSDKGQINVTNVTHTNNFRLNGGHGGQHMASSRMMSFRVYNRELSPQEICQNAWVDYLRFGGMQPTCGLAVTFDTEITPVVCTNVVIVSNTELTCTTGAHGFSGPVSVTVDNGVESATLADAFTYHPIITSVDPNLGPTTGGQNITVSGEGFYHYEPMEYLEFTGTQYINTGVNQIGNIITSLDIQLNNIIVAGILGTVATNYTTNHTATFRLATYLPSCIVSNYGNFNANCSDNVIASGSNATDRMIITIDNNKTYIDGSIVLTSSGAAPTSPMPIFLGATNIGGSAGVSMRAKVYSLQIDKDGTLDDRDFVPVCNTSTGEAGMMDRIHGVFYGNAGTGSFPGCTKVATPVVIDGAACTNVNVVSNTSLTCVTGAHPATGTYDVEVSINGAQAVPVSPTADDYTYREPMSITSVTPNVGPIYGGTNVTVTGNNFLPPALYSDGAHDYSPISYLQFNGTQWINSGVNASGNLDIFVDFRIDDDSASRLTIFGAYDDNTRQCEFRKDGLTAPGENVFVVFCPLGAAVNMRRFTPTIPSDRVRHQFQKIGTTITMDNSTITDVGQITGGVQNIWIGALNYGGALYATGSTLIGKIYSFSIDKDGTANDRNFVPVCKTSTNVGGLFDTIHSVFYPSASAVNFSCTPEIEVVFDYDGTPAFCENVIVINNTTITCTTSAHTLGLVNVRVDNGYESATKANAYEYLAPPTISITTTAQQYDIGVGGSFVLAGTISDPNSVGMPLVVSATINGVTKTASYTSNGTAIGWNLSWTAVELGEGTYDFTVSPLVVRVENRVLSSAYVSELYATANWAGKIVVDITPPTLTVTGGNVSWTNVQPSAVVTASVLGGSDLVEVRYSWNNDLGADCRSGGTQIAGTTISATITLSPVMGSTTLYACARDAAGNVATANDSYRWENIPPTAGTVSPSVAPWNNGTTGVTFTWTGYGDTGGSGLASSNVYSCTTGTNNGDTCSITIWDNAGNSTTATSPPNRVTTDGPTIDISNVGDVSWVNSASYWTNVSPVPKITASAGGTPIARIAYSWANDLNGSCGNGTAVSSGAQLSAPPEGVSVLYACAADEAGNVSTTFASFNWETIAPTCTGWSPAEAPWSKGSSVTFSLVGCTDTGGSGLVTPLPCTVDGVNGETCSITVYDNAGNYTVYTSPANRVDETGPSLVLLGGTGSGFIIVDIGKGETVPVAKIKLTPNLAPIVLWRYSFMPFDGVCTGGTMINIAGYDFDEPFIVPEGIPVGGLTVYSCAEDEAGNIVFAEAEYNWRRLLDSTTPESPNTGNWFMDSVYTRVSLTVVFLASVLTAIWMGHKHGRREKKSY